ncbi:MAG: hypothetical protein K2P79_05345 [Sphingomonas sp.]|nr:hypothetical protein [Sphingomonas sp.]
MPMTDEELKFALGNEEPQYGVIIVQLTPADIPRLQALAEGGDVSLASKAIYLASLLKEDAAHQIVARAAKSGNELLRVASATALQNLPTIARAQVAEMLIQDHNPSISKMVIRAIDAPSPQLQQRLRDLETRSTVPELKQLARQKLNNIN